VARPYDDPVKWGTNCAQNSNSFTYYLGGIAIAGCSYTASPVYGDINPVPGCTATGLNYGQTYTWKVRACNDASKEVAYCTDSDPWTFSIREPYGWWQAVGGDIYGHTVSSQIPDSAADKFLLLN
jgi:hypothetical protein